MPSQADLTLILYEPEIPPNTGNLIRLCANTGVQLHLVEPLGFSMDAKALRRAGLDYHESARVSCHPDLAHCLEDLNVQSEKRRVFAVSTRGSVGYCEPEYASGDIFGCHPRATVSLGCGFTGRPYWAVSGAGAFCLAASTCCAYKASKFTGSSSS